MRRCVPQGLMIVGEPDDEKRVRGCEVHTYCARARDSGAFTAAASARAPFLITCTCVQRAAALPMNALSQCVSTPPNSYQRALSWLAAEQTGGPIDARAQLDLTCPDASRDLYRVFD